MRVGMEIEPFSTEYSGTYDYTRRRYDGGTVTVSFFGHEIWTLEVEEEPNEYKLDEITDVALQELGKLIGKGLSERVKPNEYDGVEIDG